MKHFALSLLTAFAATSFTLVVSSVQAEPTQRPSILKALSAEEIQKLSIKERVQRLEKVLSEVESNASATVLSFKVAVMRALIDARAEIQQTRNLPLAVACANGNPEKSCFKYWLIVDRMMIKAFNQNLVSAENHFYLRQARGLSDYAKVMGAFEPLPALDRSLNIIDFVLADRRLTKADNLLSAITGVAFQTNALVGQNGPVFILNRTLLYPIQAIEALPAGQTANPTDAMIQAIDREILQLSSIQIAPREKK